MDPCCEYIPQKHLSLFCVKNLHSLGVTSSAEEGLQCYIGPPCTAAVFSNVRGENSKATLGEMETYLKKTHYSLSL
jgi:hypothetical protein